MTVPTAPGSSISFAQIQAEFGGANPIGMDEYYRATVVNSNNYVSVASANSTGQWIPSVSVAQISVANFSGAEAKRVNAPPKSIYDTNYSNGFAKARTLFRANGQYSAIRSTSTEIVSLRNTWLEKGISSNFQIRFTKYAGNNPTYVNAANNTWYAMSTDRSVHLEIITGPAYVWCSIYVTIRRTVDGSPEGGYILANVAHYLSVESK